MNKPVDKQMYWVQNDWPGTWHLAQWREVNKLYRPLCGRPFINPMSAHAVQQPMSSMPSGKNGLICQHCHKHWMKLIVNGLGV